MEEEPAQKRAQTDYEPVFYHDVSEKLCAEWARWLALLSIAAKRLQQRANAGEELAALPTLSGGGADIQEALHGSKRVSVEAGGITASYGKHGDQLVGGFSQKGNH